MWTRCVCAVSASLTRQCAVALWPLQRRPSLLRRSCCRDTAVEARGSGRVALRHKSAAASVPVAEEDEEEMLVRLLVQDAFRPAHAPPSRAEPCNRQRAGEAPTRASPAVAEHSAPASRVSPRRGKSADSAGTAAPLPAHKEADSRGDSPPVAAPAGAVATSAADEETITDSRSQNGAAELYATVRCCAGDGHGAAAGLEWLCTSCRTYNPVLASPTPCRQCGSAAALSYRGAAPPVRHVAVMPPVWVCHRCSHTNRHTTVPATAAASTDRDALAKAQRAKFHCQRCDAPFGGVQEWVCPACDHVCPRAATQCPTCFAERPLVWTCPQCVSPTTENSIFAGSCRQCGQPPPRKWSNSVVRCLACQGWNDARWELCSTCMAPLPSAGSVAGPPGQSSSAGPAGEELVPDDAGVLHSTTVVRLAALLRSSPDAAAAAGTALGSEEERDYPGDDAPSARRLPSSGGGEEATTRPRVATKLPDGAWWCFTCNVVHRRNVSFCDICLQTRDGMRRRNVELLMEQRDATAASAGAAASSTPPGDAANVSLVPVMEDSDWQCPYCRTLHRVATRECCGHRREVPCGYWLCDYCCSTNRNDRPACLGCGETHERVRSWKCPECEWGNDASSVECAQCGVPNAWGTARAATAAGDAAEAASMSIACPVCSAPNHVARAACYRCRARLRDVAWTCGSCGHGNRDRGAVRCEECQAIRQLDLSMEVWVCEVCTTPVYSGGELPVRTHCPQCNARRAQTATHYPCRWRCVCGLSNRSRVAECVECGARRRLESLDTAVTCPHCYRDTPLDVRETCTHCGGSLSETFGDIETGIVALKRAARASEVADVSEEGGALTDDTHGEAAVAMA